MKFKFLAVIIIYGLLSTVLFGCATVKEAYRGFMGVSTKVLDDCRKDAIKQSFNLDFKSCYDKTKLVLKEKLAYIYAERPADKFIAVYLTDSDTTPVGLFFTVESSAQTLIEISTPSIYAKETIAKAVFSAISGSIKSPAPAAERKIDAPEININKTVN